MTKKLKLDYVFSGTSLMRLLHAKKYENDPQYLEQRYLLIKEGIEAVTKYINDNSSMFSVSTSVLYNAYVEPKHGEFYKSKNIGFSNLYADSGGLQVVTTGKTLDDTLKGAIYKAQDISDISFCFDEIPVEQKNETTSAGGNGERTNVKSKQFNYSKFRDCAAKTAQNVLEQIESFNYSKVCYIVQGNTINDMVEWFDIAAEILGDKIEKLSGIAPADTCMGNGMLESCDMICAAKIIFDKYPTLNRHIHLLGVGSVSRMLPAILMMGSGFIEDDTTLSFDSSSNSMMFVMGKVSYMKPLDTKPRIDVEKESYKEFFEFMKPVFEKYHLTEYDIDKLADYLLENNKQFSAPEYNADNSEHEFYNIARCFVPLYCVWCNIGFFNTLERMCTKRTKRYDRLFELIHVKSLEEYNIWRGVHSHKVLSARMSRKRENTITSLFGE